LIGDDRRNMIVFGAIAPHGGLVLEGLAQRLKSPGVSALGQCLGGVPTNPLVGVFQRPAQWSNHPGCVDRA